jgi:branched-chain amino acid transport system ATP-binding protein
VLHKSELQVDPLGTLGETGGFRHRALNPDVLLLDEPTSGLPDEELHKMLDFLQTLRGEYTMLFVEHKMDVVMSLSDRVSVLHRGELIADGTVDDE